LKEKASKSEERQARVRDAAKDELKKIEDERQKLIKDNKAKNKCVLELIELFLNQISECWRVIDSMLSNIPIYLFTQFCIPVHSLISFLRLELTWR
jgi:hypothetical protein